MNFEVDFESTEKGVNENINCSLQGSNSGIPTWITITGFDLKKFYDL